MRATGIVRKVDKLGRIVIPMEYRSHLEVSNDEDALEIFVEDDKIILKKYQRGCMFCGEVKESVTLMDKTVCTDCIEKLNKMKESI